uniref:Uncharacterized protein n=1 Tax=Ananas comosus var. bracteatus TaxID=296719 RepID=A0A6V7NIM5_ANACO|nr:unnamed protein product [Ananas comosus var. bracteatus]
MRKDFGELFAALDQQVAVWKGNEQLHVALWAVVATRLTLFFGCFPVSLARSPSSRVYCSPSLCPPCPLHTSQLEYPPSVAAALTSAAAAAALTSAATSDAATAAAAPQSPLRPSLPH